MNDRINSPYPLVCAKCGIELDPERAIEIARMNLPGYCPWHCLDVIDEMRAKHSMWPSDWAGRSWKNPDGRWQYE